MILYSKEDILTRAVKDIRKCYIYFLIQDNEIVYIGQTINLPLRLSFHKQWIKYETYFALECRKEKLMELEATYLFKFAPKHNRLRGIKKMSRFPEDNPENLI